MPQHHTIRGRSFDSYLNCAITLTNHDHISKESYGRFTLLEDLSVQSNRFIHGIWTGVHGKFQFFTGFYSLASHQSLSNTHPPMKAIKTYKFTPICPKPKENFHFNHLPLQPCDTVSSTSGATQLLVCNSIVVDFCLIPLHLIRRYSTFVFLCGR